MFELIVLGVFAVLFWLFMTRNKTKRLGDFPGPRGWPIVGNVPQVENKVFHRNLTEWSKEFGGIYKINLMGDEASTIIVFDNYINHLLYAHDHIIKIILSH